jgi:hypothetical protein
MTRIDVPTLRCDRCKHTTQSISEMGRFYRLSATTMGGTTEWDLCPECRVAFFEFITGATS